MSGFIKQINFGSIVCLLLLQSVILAQDIQLPQPQTEGGMPLMEALNNRKSTRDYSDYEIPMQVLSDLLWAAYGFNRPQQKLRTVPAAWNIQNMQIYVSKADGLYLYDASNQTLKLILNEDIRAQTGTQSYAGDAAVNLIYVANLSMMSQVGDKAEFYSIAHAGFISQNVYLFCASAGLGTVVRDLIDRDALETTMELEADQDIILAQSIGYPLGYSPSSMKKEDAKSPGRALLSQNYPNPFNLETQMHYALTGNAYVKVHILDLNGVKIKTILDETQSPGEYQLKWNGLNENGKRMASGVYVYQIEVENENKSITQTRKMLMLK